MLEEKMSKCNDGTVKISYLLNLKSTAKIEEKNFFLYVIMIEERNILFLILNYFIKKFNIHNNRKKIIPHKSYNNLYRNNLYKKRRNPRKVYNLWIYIKII